jgi:hypothetical protein
MAARANIDQLLRRHDALKRKRTLIEQNWREAYDYTYPLRGALLALGGSSGSAAVDENAVHSYARSAGEGLRLVRTDSVRILSSSMCAARRRAVALGGLGVPAWTTTTCPTMRAVWLDDAADVIWKNIHNSNFDAVKYECEIDMSNAGLVRDLRRRGSGPRRLRLRAVGGGRGVGGSVEARRCRSTRSTAR